jgi:hypothetical protein
MLDCLLVLFSAAVSQKISAVPFSPFQVFFCRCYMSDATLATITISTCLHTQPSSRTFWLVALWTLYFWFLKHVYWRHTLTCVSIMKHLHLIIKLVEFNKYFFCTYCWCLKLARTVYIHRIWPYIWWFPTKNTVFTLYIYGSGQPYIYLSPLSIYSKARPPFERVKVVVLIEGVVTVIMPKMRSPLQRKSKKGHNIYKGERILLNEWKL